MKIYLLRHGETAYNVDHRYQGVTDISLSPAGSISGTADTPDALPAHNFFPLLHIDLR